MQQKANKVRGYTVNIPQFETVAEIIAALGDKRVVGVVNSQLTAHGWNSQFESALVDEATKPTEKGGGGLTMLTEKSSKGNDVIIETNAAFLKRTNYKVSAERAQALADGIEYPPKAGERGARVDAFTKVATDKVNTLEGERLTNALIKFEIDSDLSLEDGKAALIVAVANKLRSDDL